MDQLIENGKRLFKTCVSLLIDQFLNLFRVITRVKIGSHIDGVKFCTKVGSD
ncbi:unknown [Sutterella sp. CAG:521]|nr:unknown [Sutterella sp. CAG:521]